jgi:hypothetical protein
VPEHSEPNLIIGPNPTSGAFTIRTEGLKGNALIRIYDTMGRCVHKKSVSDIRNATLNLALPSGEYFVTVEASSKMVSEPLTVTR